MNRAQIGGIALEYEVRGSGEPVVLIHGSFIADGLRPLLAEPSLTERYQLFCITGVDSPAAPILMPR